MIYPKMHFTHDGRIKPTALNKLGLPICEPAERIYKLGIWSLWSKTPLMLTSVSNAGPTPDRLSPAKEQHGSEQMLHTKSGGGIKQIQAEQNWSSISWLRVRQGKLRLPEEPIYPNI